jgi:hypothetical protein
MEQFVEAHTVVQHNDVVEAVDDDARMEADWPLVGGDFTIAGLHVRPRDLNPNPAQAIRQPRPNNPVFMGH